jgi:shikimate kinase
LIALIGLPGSGKSTVGRQLAKRLHRPFYDSDQVIEQKLGCSIREYFEREGEVRFRDIEESVLDELTTLTHSVISTGGGSVLRLVNRESLHRCSYAVYLHSSPDEIFRRLRHDQHRPLLQVANPLEKLKELYEQRDPLYREVAHFVVQTGRPSVLTLVNMIVRQLELSGLVEPGR